jgi:hypothetical protein
MDGCPRTPEAFEFTALDFLGDPVTREEGEASPSRMARHLYTVSLSSSNGKLHAVTSFEGADDEELFHVAATAS